MSGEALGCYGAVERVSDLDLDLGMVFDLLYCPRFGVWYSLAWEQTFITNFYLG